MAIQKPQTGLAKQELAKKELAEVEIIKKIHKYQIELTDTSRVIEKKKMEKIRADQKLRNIKIRRKKIEEEKSRLIIDTRKLRELKRETERKLEQIERRQSTVLPEIKDMDKTLSRLENDLGLIEEKLTKLRGRKFKLEREYREFQRRLHKTRE